MLKVEPAQPDPSGPKTPLPLDVEPLDSAKSGPEQMLKITKLSPAVRSENRVNVFVNEKFSFSLDVAQVVDFKLKAGQVITEADLKKYQRASEFGKLYQRSLEWVLSRPHSIKETRDYLHRRQKKRDQQNRLVRERRARKDDSAYFGFEIYGAKSARSFETYGAKKPKNSEATKNPKNLKPTKIPSKELPPILDEDIDAVLDRLIDRGYLDDKKFAAYYLENRHASKGASLRLLRQELKQKGIADDIIEAAFAASSRDDVSEIEKAIAKKRDKYDDEKLIAYLVRRGFPYDLAKSAVEKSTPSE